MTSRLSREERRNAASCSAPCAMACGPFAPTGGNGNAEPPIRLAEIPVTTMPIFRVPIPTSAMCYIPSTFSPALARVYFDVALRLCELTGTTPSLLLDPLRDFLGCDDASDLSFFPAMSLNSSTKMAVLDWALGLYCRRYCPLYSADVCRLGGRHRKLSGDRAQPGLLTHDSEIPLPGEVVHHHQPMEVPRMNCPVCSATMHRVFQKHGYWIDQCGHCRHRSAELSPTPDHPQQVYADEYFHGGAAGYCDYVSEGEFTASHGRWYGRLLTALCEPRIGAGCGRSRRVYPAGTPGERLARCGA